MPFSLPRLVLRTGLFYARGNFAVLLGVATAALSLTGALLVGDSLRYSLGSLVEKRLGWVEEAVVSQRFFRQKTVEQLGKEKAIPAIVAQGSAQIRDAADCLLRQEGKVQILGLPDSFWDPGGIPPGWNGTNACVISSALAKKLDSHPGSSLSLRLESANAIPKESLLGNREESLQSWQIQITGILSPSDSRSSFSLRPGLDPPLTLFVPLKKLQEQLKIGDKCNCVLARKKGLQEEWRNSLDLEDYQLSLKGPKEKVEDWFYKLDSNKDGLLQPREYQGKFPTNAAVNISKSGEDWTRDKLTKFYQSERNYFSFESNALLLTPHETEIAVKVGQSLSLETEPSLVYLGNAISTNDKSIPYSIIAGVSDSFLKKLGVSEIPTNGKSLWLLDWPASPLSPAKGATVNVSYFPAESTGSPKETTTSLMFSGFIPQATLALDPDITPEFPGITDKLTLGSWNPPFPFENKRIKSADEKYWQDFRSAPKAYLKLSDAQSLWPSRFGNVTSLRLFMEKGKVAEAPLRDQIRLKILQNLNPEYAGLQFQPMRERFFTSSQSGTDFSGLFLGFSFFIIISSLALVSLLFRLHMEQRAQQIGCLSALGATPWQITILLWLEGALTALIGSLLGTLCAGFYTQGLLRFLTQSWPDESLAAILQLHIPISSLAIGASATFFACFLTLYFSSKKFSRLPPLVLLSGRTENLDTNPKAKSRVPLLASIISFLAMAALLFAPTSQDHEMRAIKFFGAGNLGLIGGLFLFTWLLRNLNRLGIKPGFLGKFLLSVRNLSRNRARSLLTSGLIAAAAFLILGVEPFRKDPENNTAVSSGTGGFSLVLETTLPVLADLRLQTGRDALLEGIRKSQRGDPGKGKLLAGELEALLNKAQLFSFRLQPGDNASCLNLFQPSKPRILGVPDSFLQRGGFRFSPGSDNWKSLINEGNHIPAIGEKNTVEWMIHSGLGKLFKIQTGLGNEKTAQFTGLLSHCLFQSELLVSEKNFLNLFPQKPGFNYFLVEIPAPGDLERMENLLALALADHGVVVTNASTMLNRFGGVENAYLSIFQGLGSLGLLLGTVGVAAVLLRSIWERRFEMALLGCLGYSPALRGRLLLIEHGLLLFGGLFLGAVSALASVIPLGQEEMRLPVLLLTLLVLFVTGLAVCATAIFFNRPKGLVEALRKE